MYISKRNSQIIAVGILVAFFVGSSLYIHFAASSTTTEEVLSSFTEEEEEALPAPTESQAALPEESASPTSTENSSQESSFALKEFHRSETRDGKTLWEIRGERARYSPESKAVVIQKCRLLYLTSDDKTITITSDTARLALLGTEVNRAVFEGNVVVVHDNGTEIKTDTAEYLKAESRITAPGEVTIQGSWYEITGIGMDGDLKENNFTLLKDVKSKLDPAKRERKP